MFELREKTLESREKIFFSENKGQEREGERVCQTLSSVFVRPCLQSMQKTRLLGKLTMNGHDAGTLVNTSVFARLTEPILDARCLGFGG